VLRVRDFRLVWCATRNGDKPGYAYANNGFRVMVTEAQT